MQHTVYLFDGFHLDVTRRKLVSSGGLVQPLNSRAMDALLLLVENAGELVEKRRLMQTIWPNAVVEDNNLNQCVLAIRKALGETAGSNRYIMTVPGRGYRFVCPVRKVAQESAADAATVVTRRQRSPRALLMGIASGLCAALLTIAVFRVASRPRGPAITPYLVASSEQPESLPSLQIQDPVTGVGHIAISDLAATLADCLAARPDAKLLVQIQLLADDGQQVWSGNYFAEAQGSHRTQVPGDLRAPDCGELVGVVGPTRQAVSIRHSPR